MTTLRVGQRGAGVPYGAAELKQVYYRNFSTALLISSILHIAVVLGYFAVPHPAQSLPGPTRGPRVSSEGTVTVLPPPSIAAPKAPEGGSGIDVRVEEGTVVMVADDEASLKTTLGHQKEMNPESSGEGTGGGEETGTAGQSEAGPIVIGEPEKELWMVEVEPIVVTTAKPVYPPLAIRSGLEGKVWVKILVGKDGRPVKAVILKSTHGIFEQAALEAAKAFLFTPGYMSSGAVAVWVSIPFSFKLSAG